jgi:hypothetical protein
MPEIAGSRKPFARVSKSCERSRSHEVLSYTTGAMNKKYVHAEVVGIRRETLPFIRLLVPFHGLSEVTYSLKFILGNPVLMEGA